MPKPWESQYAPAPDPQSDGPWNHAYAQELIPPTTPGGIDPSKVAGASATGMGLPGASAAAAPNPIAGAKTTVGDYLFGVGKTPQSKRVAALQADAAPGGWAQNTIQNAPQDLSGFGQAAVDNLHSDVNNLRAGTKQFIHAPIGTEIGQVVTSPLTAAIGAMENVGHGASDIAAGHPIVGVSRIAGGNPELANQALQQGNVGGYAWNMFGQPAAMVAGGELASKAATDAANTLHPLDAGPKTNDAFAHWISGGVKGETPQVTASVARPVFQQAAQDLGWKNPDFVDRVWKGNTPSRNTPFQTGPFRNTYKGMEQGLKLADHAVDISDKPMDVVMKEAANVPIDPAVKGRISSGLRTKASEANSVGNSQLAKSYNDLADTVDTQKTYGELNKLKKNANNQMERMGAPGTISQQIAQSTTPIAAWQDLGGLVRENMYPVMQQRYIPAAGQPGYFDVGQMGLREKAVLDARDGVYKGFDEAARLDAASGSISKKEKATSGSMYDRKFAIRMLGVEPTPAGKFNILMRRGLGDIGVNGTPESISRVPVSQPLALPAPPGYAQFQVPTAPAVPGTVPGTGNPMSMTYAGPRTVPNPNHTPLSSTSQYQQARELGSTATTIPQRVRGIPTAVSQGSNAAGSSSVWSPARIEANQVGVGHSIPAAPGAAPRNFGNVTPPLRSFTGPETLTEANFQHNFGTAHADDVNPGTAGMMQTNDPAVAQRAYGVMQKYMRSPSFQKLPPQTQMLAQRQAGALGKQLASHQAVQGMAGSVQYQIHWTPANLGTQLGRQNGVISRVVGHGARAMVQSQLKNPPKASNADMTPEQRKADDDRRQKEQDDIIRNYQPQ